MMSLKLTRGPVLGAALMLAHAPIALAAGGESTPLNLEVTTAKHVTTSSGASSGIMRTVIGLVIVVALIYGVAWVLRRVKGKGARASGHGLTQLASLPLGGGRSMALVRAGKEVVLVGIAEHGVTPIRTYSEAEVIAGGIDPPEDQPPDNEPADDLAPGLLHQLRRLTVRS